MYFFQNLNVCRGGCHYTTNFKIFLAKNVILAVLQPQHKITFYKGISKIYEGKQDFFYQFLCTGAWMCVQPNLPTLILNNGCILINRSAQKGKNAGAKQKVPTLLASLMQPKFQSLKLLFEIVCNCFLPSTAVSILASGYKKFERCLNFQNRTLQLRQNIKIFL